MNFVVRQACFGLCLMCSAAAACWAQEPAAVTVALVVEKDFALGQAFVGTIVPLRRSAVGSAVDGRVVELHVNEGDRVAGGQPLAKLRTETVQIELAGARAELLLRRQELAELKNGSRPEEIDAAKARMLGALALWEYAKENFERQMTLFKQGLAVTQDELDQARSTATQTEQAYLEAKAAHALAVAGPREERIAQAEARVMVQQEMVRQIEDRLARHTVVAPFDGYVVAEHTELGQWVSSGDPIVDIVEIDEVDVRIFLPENIVPQIKVGMKVRVEVDALPGEAFDAVVAFLVPAADVSARTFPLNVRIANPLRDADHRLKPGMLARVNLPVGHAGRALVVPKDALVLGGERPMVFVVAVNSKLAGQTTVRAVPVQLGAALGAWMEVKGELKPGEQVVVQGNERLRPGQAVAVVRTMTEKDAAGK